MPEVAIKIKSIEDQTCQLIARNATDPFYRSAVNVQLKNFSKNEKVNISVVDYMGKLVKTISYTNEQGEGLAVVDAGYLTKQGIYVIQVATPTGKLFGKLIVR